MSRGTDSDFSLFLGTSQSENCSCNQADPLTFWTISSRICEAGLPCIYKNRTKQSAAGAVSPAATGRIPTIRADYFTFASKVLRIWPYLLGRPDHPMGRLLTRGGGPRERLCQANRADLRRSFRETRHRCRGTRRCP